MPRELTIVVNEADVERDAIKKLLDERWSTNPQTIHLDPSTILKKIAVEIMAMTEEQASNELCLYKELQAFIEANKQFKKYASYVYNFGKGKYF